MTLPYERKYALDNTRDFLLDLTNPKATPKVPLAVRRRARWALKHFPTPLDVQQIIKKAPKVISNPE